MRLQLAMMHNQLSGWNSNKAGGGKTCINAKPPPKKGRLAKSLSSFYIASCVGYYTVMYGWLGRAITFISYHALVK
jgi:hypothetical protein